MASDPAHGKAFPEQGMTFVEFVQHVIPDVSDVEADYILWNETPFPFAKGRDDLMPYLIKARDQRAGDPATHHSDLNGPS